MKIRDLFIFFCITLTLTSCFEVIEEVNLNEQGGGDFKLTINLSKSKDKVKGILEMDTIGGKHVPSIDEITREVDEIIGELGEVDGISEVKANKNFDDFILSIGYHFRDVSALNRSIKEIIDIHAKNPGKITSSAFYEYNNNVFMRKSDFDYSVILDDFSSEVKIVDASSYTCIYRFDKSIKSASNDRANISKSGKATLNRIKASSLIGNKELINNKITLE